MKINHSKELKAFTEKLSKIPGVRGIFYTGSTAKETWDEYSDIDIEVLVKDNAYAELVKKIPALVAMWGKVKFINTYKGLDDSYAFMGEDYLKLEIALKKQSDVKPSWWFREESRIAYDPEGILTKNLQDSKKMDRPKLNHEEFVHLFLDMRSSFIYIARHYARGQKLSAVSELGRIGGDLFFYLGKVKGLEGYEHVRQAEKNLTQNEWAFVKSSRCTSMDKAELKRCIKVNWDYMKYLETLYEKTSKRRLQLKCNDDEILEVVRKILG